MSWVIALLLFAAALLAACAGPLLGLHGAAFHWLAWLLAALGVLAAIVAWTGRRR